MRAGPHIQRLSVRPQVSINPMLSTESADKPNVDEEDSEDDDEEIRKHLGEGVKPDKIKRVREEESIRKLVDPKMPTDKEYEGTRCLHSGKRVQAESRNGHHISGSRGQEALFIGPQGH